MSDGPTCFPYLHGFDPDEQERLYRQAEFMEQLIYRDIDFSECTHILEVGCGVGAQTAILLRRFPHLKITAVDASETQLARAKDHLDQLPYARGRYAFQKMDAQALTFTGRSFDGAFLCWVLEHVPDPGQVLSEVRRTLQPGSKVAVTEVMNQAFFLDPYSPNVWKYWMAFNDYQLDNRGDPFVGAKLGNLMSSVGYGRVETTIKHVHLDNRRPEKRRQMIEDRRQLLLSAAEQLIKSDYVDEETVRAATKELEVVQHNPNAVIMDAFMQAFAQTGV